MAMKAHLLAGLREQFAQWDGRLASLTEAEAEAPRPDGRWSRREEVVHLWGWQQLTLARLTAAAAGGAPQFPAWLDDVPGGWEADADVVNAALVRCFHDHRWPRVYADWRAGYREVIETAAALAEVDLLDSDRFPWLGEHALAAYLLATYAHHQEHLEAW
jgi:hypothetical protein